VRISATPRFIIKLDEGFRKYFKGFIIIPVRRKIFENTPIDVRR
jgi:hypothetical protein